MYGLISKIDSTEGYREKLIEILINGTKKMSGCKLYVVAADTTDEIGIWITEVWDCEESHKASLQLPDVQKAITEGKPMIASFSSRNIVNPIGGVGIDKL